LGEAEDGAAARFSNPFAILPHLGHRIAVYCPSLSDPPQWIKAAARQATVGIEIDHELHLVWAMPLAIPVAG
jgi:hypothetical protein